MSTVLSSYEAASVDDADTPLKKAEPGCQLVFVCSVCHNPITINATSDAVVAWRDFLQLLLGIGNDVWAEPALYSSCMLSASFFAPYTHGPHHQCTARWTPMLASLPYTLYRSNADGECAPQ